MHHGATCRGRTPSPRRGVWTGDIEDTFHTRSETSRTLAGPLGDSARRSFSMPWRELTVTDQREEFVKLALAPGANMRELCRRFGIARSCGHKWVRRYLAEGCEGL